MRRQFKNLYADVLNLARHSDSTKKSSRVQARKTKPIHENNLRLQFKHYKKKDKQLELNRRLKCNQLQQSRKDSIQKNS